MSREFDDDFEDISVNKNASRNLELDPEPEEEDRSRRSDASRRVERADRRRRRKKKKNHTALWLILLMLIVGGGVVGAKYWANSHGMALRQLPSYFLSGMTNQAQEETEAATEASTEESTEAAVEVTLTQDANADILDLVKSYYDARVAADSDALSKILADGVKIDTDKLDSEKEFVEGYTDIATYVTNGMSDGEYAVYISYNEKFKDIETAAPGLAPCYVVTAADGTMRLSFYNDWDSTTKSYMNEVSSSKAVTELAEKVSTEFAAAKDSDADLKNFLAALAGETTDTTESTEAAETTAAESQSETTAAASQAETTAAATTAASTTAASEEENFTTTDDIQYTTTQVRCRKQPSLEETDEYTMLEAGTWLHVIAISEHWSKVNTADGTIGYVYNEYLTPDKPETEAEE